MVLFTGLVVSCMNYFKVNTSAAPTVESVGSLDRSGKTFVFHFENDTWLLTGIDIADSALTGELKPYDQEPTLRTVKPGKPNRYTKRASRDQSYLLNEVHLYAGEYASLSPQRVSIPFGALTRMEIYDKDTQATVGSYILGGLGIAAGTYLVVGIIALLTKESCPFVYVREGEAYRFAGEIYSGSIHPPLERHDFLRLPATGDRGTLTLKIANEVKEVQHTNLLELIVATHPTGVEVLADKYGKLHTLAEPVAPITAINLEGREVTEWLTRKEGRVYVSNPAGPEFPLRDGVVLTFPNPRGTTSVKACIRAKNSVIFDYMMGQFHDLFGYGYPQYMQHQARLPAEELRQLALERGFPLSLSVERNGHWEFVDYYPIAGPMALRDDILEVPLLGNEGDSLKIKLESATFLWEIDYAALDFSPPAEVVTTTVPLTSAVDETGKDVARLLREDDALYYVQPDVGNQAVVTFDLPDSTSPHHTLLLHSKGWYRILRNPGGIPDKEGLRAFRDPEHFSRFINRRMQELGQRWALKSDSCEAALSN